MLNGGRNWRLMKDGVIIVQGGKPPSRSLSQNVVIPQSKAVHPSFKITENIGITTERSDSVG
jgi:hypothetical protein